MDETTIRAAKPEDADACGRIAAEAWAPIRASVREHLGDAIYDRFGDRKEQKRRAVMQFVRDHPDRACVTERDGRVVGFLTWMLRTNEAGIVYGEICNNAVDPSAGGGGVGTRQCAAALEAMRRTGARYATVHTGGDDAHARARRMYQKAGFDHSFPEVAYYMDLGPHPGQ